MVLGTAYKGPLAMRLVYVSDDTTKLGLFLLRYKDEIIDS